MTEKGKRPRWLGEDRRTWDHVRVHEQLIEDPRVGAQAMAVYLGLAKHAELESGQTFVGLQTLADYTGLSWRSVHRALKALAAAGYVTIEPREGRTSLYRLLPPPPPLTHSHGSEGGTPDCVSGVVLTVSQGTPVQNANEQEPLDKNQVTKVTPLVSPSARREETDSLWSALLAAMGVEEHQLTKRARQMHRTALRDLRGVGATPEQVAERAAVARDRWSKPFGPIALATHWADLAPVVVLERRYESGRITEVPA